MIVQNWETLLVLCRLETGFRVSANHAGAVGARDDRQNVGRNLHKRYCVRENLGNAAGEHGRCRMCDRTPHTRDCESESREGAVVELG